MRRTIREVVATWHQVTVRSNGTKFDVETKSATDAMSRVAALGTSGVARGSLSARRYRTLKPLDDRV